MSAITKPSELKPGKTGAATYEKRKPIIETIRELQAHRVAAMKQLLRIGNQCRAFIRRALGFQTILPKKERDRITTLATKIYNTTLEEGLVEYKLKRLPKKPHELPVGKDEKEQSEIDAAVKFAAPYCKVSVLPTNQYEGYKKKIEKRMEVELEKLEVWEQLKAVRGFGATGMSIILGECGDLSNYANPTRVWKRLGLAVRPDGLIQGNVPKGLSRDARREAWIENQYAPRRRSTSWTVASSLMQGNKGKWKTIYDKEKKRQRKLNPEPIFDKSGKKVIRFSDRHIHNRAQRYMEKEFLKHVWNVWTDFYGLTDWTPPPRPDPEKDEDTGPATMEKVIAADKEDAA